MCGVGLKQVVRIPCRLTPTTGVYVCSLKNLHILRKHIQNKKCSKTITILSLDLNPQRPGALVLLIRRERFVHPHFPPQSEQPLKSRNILKNCTYFKSLMKKTCVSCVLGSLCCGMIGRHRNLMYHRLGSLH